MKIHLFVCICIYCSMMNYGPSTKRFGRVDPPLEWAEYEDIPKVSLRFSDYLDLHMKYCEFHFYDAALRHAYVYDMARILTRYALCFNFFPAYCIFLTKRSKT